MPLQLKPSYAPMEALSVSSIPEGPSWQYEPKWDGFRCLAFRDGNKVELQSKSGQSLARYFPEIVTAVQDIQEATVPETQTVAETGAPVVQDTQEPTVPETQAPPPPAPSEDASESE